MLALSFQQVAAMLPKSSFAMVQTATRTLEARDVPIPEIDEDSAILEIEACGICGSDLEQYQGVISVTLPLIPGHEPLGRIVKIGDRAARRWHVEVGDRVAVETMLSCRFCSSCLDGHYHLCRDRRIYSYIPLTEAPGLWGAYSQYMYLHPNSIVAQDGPRHPARDRRDVQSARGWVSLGRRAARNEPRG